MKKTWSCLGGWLSGASIMFTSTVVIYLAFCLHYGQKLMEISLLWTFLLVSVLGALAQWICFTELLFKKMRYTLRLALFVLFFYPLLSLVAWKGKWFPMTADSWLMFTGLFLGIFAAMTAGFEIYYRTAGRKYDGILGQYRREKNENEKKAMQNGENTGK